MTQEKDMNRFRPLAAIALALLLGACGGADAPPTPEPQPLLSVPARSAPGSETEDPAAR